MVSNGSQIADINECTETPGICGSNGVCADTIGAYTCSCEEGYERDQQQCRSIKRGMGKSREYLFSGQCVVIAMQISTSVPRFQAYVVGTMKCVWTPLAATRAGVKKAMREMESSANVKR